MLSGILSVTLVGGNDLSVAALPEGDSAATLSGIGYTESTGGFKFAGFDSNIPVLL
ncbi:hypothetical protein KZ770_00420 [Escherichia coli]|nr:hypothetical protein [Escherichia coli]